MRRPVHLAGFAQLPHVVDDAGLDEAEMVRVVCAAALDDAGLSRSDVGFVCSGSSDYAMVNSLAANVDADNPGGAVSRRIPTSAGIPQAAMESASS